MSESSERPAKHESSDADTTEAENGKGQEPSLQEHHDPGTDADSASGGSAD